MTMNRFYPIGTPGQKWTPADVSAWREQCHVERSYEDEVRSKLREVSSQFQIEQYGALPIAPNNSPLFVVQCEGENPELPWALVTGGVHGYETSGVQGALAFLKSRAASYADRVNLVVVPCVSPWAYEVINRWNPDAIDPNRSFIANSPAYESAALMNWVREAGIRFLVHIDLHETTDSDETAFRPALAARDGLTYQPGEIPDGFYTVGDTENAQPSFQARIIAAVERVTHIAPADINGEIIGSPVVQHGVINYPFKALGLCAGLTDARFTTTTEVYPDSPRATDEICNQAQVAAVCAALDFATSPPAA